jgi:Na+/H+ antiporter NhaB
MQDFLSMLRDLTNFLGQEKKWWLLPICVVLIIMTIVIVLAESSAIAPFVYTLF